MSNLLDKNDQLIKAVKDLTPEQRQEVIEELAGYAVEDMLDRLSCSEEEGPEMINIMRDIAMEIAVGVLLTYSIMYFDSRPEAIVKTFSEELMMRFHNRFYIKKQDAN